MPMRKIVHVEEMPDGLIICTKDLLIVGTGTKKSDQLQLTTKVE